MRKWCWLLGALAACNGAPAVPGNETMGVFAVTAQLTSSNVSAAVSLDGGNDFSFVATLSRFRPNPGVSESWAFVTVANVSRDAGFDGQVLTSLATAPRVLPSCGQVLADGGYCYQVNETLTLALLSSSQDQALGGRCPDNLLDGGIPSGPGISRPASKPGGFDGVRVCGTLVDEFQPGDTCPCAAGTATFALNGSRAP